MTFGGWMWTALGVLAKLRGLRGSALDVFGYALDRRVERELGRDYARTMRELAARLRSDNMDVALQIASLPGKIRGYGHVKNRNLRVAKRQEAELLGRLGIEMRTVSPPARCSTSTPARRPSSRYRWSPRGDRPAKRNMRGDR